MSQRRSDVVLAPVMQSGDVPLLLLTITQAAQRLNVSRSLLYDLVLSGEMVSIKIKKARRIPVAELEAFIQKQLQGGKDDE
ncbi:MAG: helix-turn-helix domain-containing protein [Ktedonobacterales bacterium]|nr:helix-turn-helix domain-containing protein [Ktedonobacterales bacterium]